MKSEKFCPHYFDIQGLMNQKYVTLVEIGAQLAQGQNKRLLYKV